ncbi:hypothetical protein HPB50_012075 [Hyalomma asiaticum]|uniref:Uncharacterized protein n=1 Tax=Hyalomma asiaticum TaxID=266040 RepID=A0ACB7SLZ2_HYAAI|nr:hypothetical protein HPB50_012075 [Hyalomma asiaticum]
MSPTSREATALEKDGAVSGWLEDHDAMFQAGRKRTGEAKREFESGTPPDSCGDVEHPTLTRVQRRSAKPSKHQRALTPKTYGYRDSELWLYKDQLGCVHGPFSGACMASWFASGCFRMSLPVKRTCDREFQLLGKLMNTLGRLPFLLHQTSPNQPKYSADQLPAKDGTPTSTTDCIPGNEDPPLDYDGEFLKQTSSVDPQEKPRAMASIDALPMSGETQPEIPLSARVRSVERVKAFDTANSSRSRASLVFRDTAELLAEDNHTTGGLKKQVNQHEGAWGGYEKYQPPARSFESAAAKQPVETKNAAGRRTSGASADTAAVAVAATAAAASASAAAPKTWAKVSLKAPTKPQVGHERGDPAATPEPVAIENMTRFPSRGGKAFVDAAQSKTRNQQHDPAWARRAAADQDFTRWSYDRLRNLPSYVHVPTFFELLRDVDSSAEIEEYVRMHFGNGDEAIRFAQEFVRRRLQWKQLTGWKSPAELCEATTRTDVKPKGRKKAQKLNGAALGFVVAGEAFKKA